MKNDKMKEVTEMLESGVKRVFESGEYQKMLDVMGRFHKYSANNCFLIIAQKPEATHVAGFRSWQNNFKRTVKKGEKAIYVIAPCPHKTKKESVNDNGETETVEINWISYRAVPVFDISQTEGEELPEVAKVMTGNVDEYEDLFNRIKSASPVPVTFDEIKGGALGYFSPSENNIVIKQGMSEQQTVKTLIHEIAHAMLHGKDGEEKEADRNTREVQAESIAYIVCNNIGLDTSDYSFGYIAGWSTGKETKELVASMEVIRKTAGGLIDALAA